MLKENMPILEEVNIPIWHKVGYTGKGIHIVVLDDRSGVLKHMPYATAPLIRPDYGSSHGTSVAQCAHVFAPGARITLIHSTQQGRAWIQDNIQDIDLINISMSSHVITSAEKSFGFLKEYDIPIICSSGNYSKNGVLDEVRYPANFLWTEAIGAYNWRDSGVKANDVTSYSNGGKNLKCVAPTNIYVMNNEGKIFTFDGTSAAAPSATGMLACYGQYLKENGMTLTREKGKKFIRENCIDIKEKGFDHASGYGLFYMPAVPKIPVKSADDEIKEEVKEEMEQYFKDVGPSSALFNDIQKANERGIAKGFSDGTFRPNETVTRGQSVAMLNRAIDFMLKEAKKQ